MAQQSGELCAEGRKVKLRHFLVVLHGQEAHIVLVENNFPALLEQVLLRKHSSAGQQRNDTIHLELDVDRPHVFQRDEETCIWGVPALIRSQSAGAAVAQWSCPRRLGKIYARREEGNVSCFFLGCRRW